MRWRRRDPEAELERELRDDLELEAAELEARGMPVEAARAAARRAFGNVTRTKEEVRSMWGWTTWGIGAAGFRDGVRNLRKIPGFTIPALVALALGTGASTAVFTAGDSVVLKPLPYPESGRLVAVWEKIRFLGGE